MAISVVMPALELAQESGKLLSWRKKEGERVSKGEPLLEIETDKVVVEIEAPADGILAGITAHEGAVLPVGQTIAWILLPGESVPQATPAPAARRAAAEPAHGISLSAGASKPAPSPAAARCSPKARRLAREHGINLADVHGSGPEGEILASDIESLIKARGSGAPAETEALPLEPLSGAARLMAERTAQSWTSVPHFFLTCEVDARALNTVREQLLPAIESSHRVRLTHTDLLIAAAGRTLLKHSRLNASWTPDGIRMHREVHIGLAIAVKDAVVSGVIRNAAAAPLADIALQRHGLTERARAGKLQPADVAGATFTISNLGMHQVDAFSAIIVPPQAAILAVGRIADRVVAEKGQPVVCPMLTLTLSCDHRVVDGARAAVFLGALAEAIRNAETWLRPHS
jgi:pyruvate dehydrogenase E2 component (dihydrolipoamide acetyltransferase)